MKVSQMTNLAQILVLAAGLSLTTQSFAGGNKCKEVDIPKAALINGGILAASTIDTINKERAKAQARGEELDVVVIARTGTDPGSSVVLRDFDESGRFLSVQDLYGKDDPYDNGNNNHYSHINKQVDKRRKLVYSHLGLAFRNHPLAEQIQAERNLPEKPWVMVHMLKPCGTLVPDLFDEGIWNFFLDDPYKYGSMVIVPTYDFQKRLEQVVLQDEISYNFLGAKYNALALFDDVYEQNSNQWVLEVFAAAMAPRGQVRTRADAVRVLKSTNYIPTRMHLRGKYAFAKLFGPDSVSFKKQQGHGDIVQVITVLSMREYLQRNKLWVKEVALEIPKSQLIKDDSKGQSNGGGNDWNNGGGN